MNSRYTLAFLVWSFSFIATTSPATAEILFEHPFPDHGRRDPWCSSCEGIYRVWDQFDLVNNATVTEIQARLYFRTPPVLSDISIEYSVWDVTRTNQIFAQSFLPGDLSIDPSSSDLESYDVDADITDLPLAAGSYTLSIYSLSTSRSRDIGWWTTETTVHGKSFQTDGGSGGNQDMAFRIIGTIPEPTSLWLLGLGLLGLIGRRRT